MSRELRRQRRLGAARQNHVFIVLGPSFVADAGTGEVDDTADAFERAGIESPTGDVPFDLVGAASNSSYEGNRSMARIGEGSA
ncbi:MAG: hypothetical protein R2706_16795 [Acidimicrobiales bacterium]